MSYATEPSRLVSIKSARQIERMAVAGRLVADVLDAIEAAVSPGVTALELDRLATDRIRAGGGVPSFVGEPGVRAPYRHATCISIDREVVHAIPTGRRLRAGQLVSVDVGAIVDGWHGDAARTFLVGEVAPAARRLAGDAERALYAGIAAAVPGAHLGDIALAVESIGRAGGWGVVEPFGGHGIGTEMHEAPHVPNYWTGSRGRRIEVGLCIAIEPMFTAGSHEVRMRDDGWTVETVDGSLAAHWEHTIAVTADGPRILTVNDGS